MPEASRLTLVPPKVEELFGITTLSFPELRGLSEPGILPYFTGLPLSVFPDKFPLYGLPYQPLYP